MQSPLQISFATELLLVDVVSIQQRIQNKTLNINFNYNISNFAVMAIARVHPHRGEQQAVGTYNYFIAIFPTLM